VGNRAGQGLRRVFGPFNHISHVIDAPGSDHMQGFEAEEETTALSPYRRFYGTQNWLAILEDIKFLRFGTNILRGSLLTATTLFRSGNPVFAHMRQSEITMFGINIIETVSVANSGLSATRLDQVRASINAAAEAWGRYIDAPNAVVDISLTIDNIPGNALATAGAQFFGFTGGTFESRVTQELAGNTDVNPGSIDGLLRIDLARLQDPNFYFFDTSFEADPEGLGFSEFDFLSVMVHEFGHILGLTIASNFTTGIMSH